MNGLRSKRLSCGWMPLFLAAMLAPATSLYGGNTTVYEYDGFMQSTRVYVYDSAAGVTASDTRPGYDELGRQTLVRRVVDISDGTSNANDDITLYAYDVTGALSKLIRKGGSNTDLDSSESGDAVTEYVYDVYGRQVTASTPAGGQTISEYDISHNFTKQSVLKSGSTYMSTTTEYDALNRATKVINPESHYREISFNTRSLAYKQVAKNAGGTTLSQQRTFFDDVGRQTKTVVFADAGAGGSGNADTDRVVLLDYDSGGRVITQTSYNMNTSTALETVNAYDDIGRITSATDPIGVVQTTAYDAGGLMTAQDVSDVVGNQFFSHLYDADARLTDRIAHGEDLSDASDDRTTSFAYDGFDRRTKIIDPLNQELVYEYDDIGRQTKKKEDATGIARITESVYDRLSRLITLTADDGAGLQHTVYSYDLADRRTNIEYPDAVSVVFEFDLAGRMTQRTDQRGIVIDYEYDDRGLLTKKDVGTPEENFAYDGLGRMTVAKNGVSGNDDAVSETTYVYDDLSRMTQETQELFEEGAGARSIEHEYDQAGNRLTLLYEPSGATSLSLAYKYDESSQGTHIEGKFRNAPNTLTQYEEFVTNTYKGHHFWRRSLKTLYDYEATVTKPPAVYLNLEPLYDDHRNVTRLTNKTKYDGSNLDELARFDYRFDKAGNRLANKGKRGAGASASGFSKIQKIPTYNYDGLYRLVTAQYDLGGGVTKNEDFEYDDLGNRVTYQDHRNSITTAYADNVVNEYTSIGGTSVSYDASGNLSRDENDYEYLYDYENRLTSVTYEGGTGSTQVAHFAYDALGRMVSSQLRFDADTSAMNETLKYYYDGQNAIAEYDESDNLSRRYIHGTTQIDELAVLLEGEGDSLDTYYYLLQELGTVTGLMQKNGALVEANVYDAYGKVTPWGYRPVDFNRDGDVDTGNNSDQTEMSASLPSNPAADPQADVNMDGLVSFADQSAFNTYVTGSGEPPITLNTSAVGNPYFFTGRRLHFTETLHDGSPEDTEVNEQVQYNRARHYHPNHGRWLQRDPAGYVDGMNLYEYVSSRPTLFVDPGGRRKIGFKFAAFISSNFPLWNDEPWDILHEFRGDARGAGRAGTSRLSTDGWVESTKIGRLGLGDGYIFTDSGTSFRRNKITGSVTPAKASVGQYTNLANDERKCKSTFVVTASSAYPFSALSPDIDYFITISFTVVRDGVILAEMKGGHDSFPDYEGLVDRVLGHSYATPFAGPSPGNLGSSNPGVQFSTQWLVNAPTPKCCP